MGTFSIGKGNLASLLREEIDCRENAIHNAKNKRNIILNRTTFHCYFALQHLIKACIRLTLTMTNPAPRMGQAYAGKRREKYDYCERRGSKI